MPKIMLATLCLNEMEWLPSLYAQHRNWPNLDKWVFVEAADKIYAQTNPKRVTNKGLSVDGTSDFLSDLARKDPKIVYIPHGITEHKDPAQCKIPARNRYLQYSDGLRPDFVYVIDADEFYTYNDQLETIRMMQKLGGVADGFTFKQRHAWRPVSIVESASLLQYEVVGGYWSVPHTRGWKWRPKMQHTLNHNSPHGFNTIRQLWRSPNMPQCVHTGFASALRWRAAKHRYYEARGEGRTDKRQMYVDCRAAFESWEPGQRLPHDASVRLWDGPIPECFAKNTTASEHSLIRVLEIDGGRLSWRFGMAGTIELYDIRVDDDRMRQGIATRMMNQIMSEHSDKTLYGFCRENNGPILNMYHKLGFDLIPTPSFYGRGEPSGAVMIIKRATNHGNDTTVGNS